MLRKRIKKRDTELLWKIERHSFNPGIRIWARVEPLVEEIIKHGNAKEKKEVLEHAKELRDIRKVLNFTYISRNICFVLAYISFFSVIIGNVFLVGEIIKWAGYLSGLAGTALLIVIFTVLEKFITLYANDMQIISSHIIAIYHKYKLIRVGASKTKKKTTKKKVSKKK